jgi:predicted nucleotidyltransferase
MEVDGILTKAKKDADVVAVFLFGSRARGGSVPGSDTDVCLVLGPGNYGPMVVHRKRLSYLKEGNTDVHVFSQLPLYIRRRVLKEGRILLCRDDDLLYEIAFRTAQAFEDFRHLYYGYLEELAHVGP